VFNRALKGAEPYRCNRTNISPTPRAAVPFGTAANARGPSPSRGMEGSYDATGLLSGAHSAPTHSHGEGADHQPLHSRCRHRRLHTLGLVRLEQFPRHATLICITSFMIIIRFAVFACTSVITIVLFARNTSSWGKQFRDYMIRQQAKASLTGDVSWQRPWTVYLSKAMVVFFGLMIIVLMSVVCFSQ